MNINELTTSKYLKKEDIAEPTLVTVRDVQKENVALPNQPKKERGVIYFQEFDKGMVLNTTNLKRSTKAMGSDETQEWVGKKLVIYVDEEVEFGGEIVGGLRIRAAKTQSKPIGKTKFDDLEEVPFDRPFKGFSVHVV